MSPRPDKLPPIAGGLSPRQLLRLSVAVALLTIGLKTLAWWLTGSVGLLSDALESLVNLAGAMFALAMVTIAARPADAEHPYGHAKAEYFSAGFEGLLVIAASLAIIWAALLRLSNPAPLEQLGWGLGLSLFSTGLNGGLAWVMLRAARRHRSIALEGDAQHLLTDVWTSVGVVLGLLAAGWTGWLWLDSAVAIGVALNIFWQGGQLLWRSVQGLMDAALPPEQGRQIDALLQEFVRQQAGAAPILFDNLQTRQAGGQSFCDVHLHVPGSWTLDQAAELRTRVETALLQAIPGLYARIELLPLGLRTESESETRPAAAALT